MKLAERDVTRTIRDFLVLRGWSPVRINAGPFGKAGLPDYLFLHYAHREHLWIEFKSPTDRRKCRCRPGSRRKCTVCAQAEWALIEGAKGARVWRENDYEAFRERYDVEFASMGLEVPDA